MFSMDALRHSCGGGGAGRGRGRGSGSFFIMLL